MFKATGAIFPYSFGSPSSRSYLGAIYHRAYINMDKRAIFLKMILKCRGIILIPVTLILLSCSNREAVKFNPGHYVAVGTSLELSGIKYLDDPAVQGVNKRYFWRTLEPEKGEYDFSSIEEDLNYLAAHHKQLIVFLCDRTFWIKGAMPEYLSEYEVEADGGFNPVRWNPVVVERLVALGKALGERFDSHPNFEGVAIQESALDLPEEVFKRFDYSPERYRDALIAIITGMQRYLPDSHVFWYQNFMSGDDGHCLRQIADAMTGSGVIMGGPDVLPYNRAYHMVSYPLYEDYKNSIILFCSAQDDSYRHDKNDIRVSVKEPVYMDGYLTMEDIFLFARDSLHVSYMFWNYYYEGTGRGERSYDDAIRVIRKYPLFNSRKDVKK